MIIREIKNNPDKVVANFDFFNDYKDTRAWALRFCPESTIELLDKKYKEWNEKIFDEFRQQQKRL